MLRILIVDDHAMVRAALRRSLKRYFDIVGELSDGYACASEVEETSPDVVIMDCDMPMVAGDEATRQVKALFPHVMVVGFTAGEPGLSRLRDAGADLVFTKDRIKDLLTYLKEMDQPEQPSSIATSSQTRGGSESPR